jgi:hypothetical protein
MPCYDGPYTIIDTDEEHSKVMLDLPNSPNIFLAFHTSMVILFVENDATLFPGRKFLWPDPVVTEDGSMEYFIWDIIDEKRCGRGYRYLMQWVGYGPEEDH